MTVVVDLSMADDGVVVVLVVDIVAIC